MSTNRILSALAAFAGGVAAGILLAPRSGSETREYLAEEAKNQLKGISRQLRNLEGQVAGIADQVKSAGGELTQKVRQATVDQVVPEVPGSPDDFSVKDGEVATDLRHLPRK